MDNLHINRQHRKFPGVYVRLVTWPGHLDWTSLWKILCECLFKSQQTPLRCEGAELSWALAAHFCHTQHSVVTVGWTGEGRAEHSHLAAEHSHLAVHHHQTGLCWGVLLSFVVMLRYLSEGPHCAVGGVKHSACVEMWMSFSKYCFKHGWIFIHVAEAGLPCKCILKVFHLPNPSCTSDNLQYYFFC